MIRISIIVGLVLILAFPIVSGAGTVHKSDVQDQEDIKVTIYNNNMGLIKDTRRLTLPGGEGELRFMDVASHIMPVTVHAKSQTTRMTSRCLNRTMSTTS